MVDVREETTSQGEAGQLWVNQVAGLPGETHIAELPEGMDGLTPAMCGLSVR